MKWHFLGSARVLFAETVNQLGEDTQKGAIEPEILPSYSAVKGQRFSFNGLILISLLVNACSAVRVEEEREMHATPATPPTVVYVKDFDLQSRDFRGETDILPLAPLTINGPTALIPRLLGVPEDNVIRASELVNLMSSATLRGP